MKRVISYTFLMVSCVVLSLVARGSVLGDLATGALVSLAIPLLDSISNSRVQLRHLWYAMRYSKTDIRISAAYLFRIKIDDKYLLIKGRRFAHYQPVGGVYKATSDGRAFLATLGAKDDSLIPIDSDSSGDLRIRIKGKLVPRFYAWFDSRKGREDSPWREFYEELVASAILPRSDFPFVFHNYLRRDVDRIRYSQVAKSLEILIADIYELLPSSAQETSLRALIANHRDEVVWVSEDEVERLGVTPGAAQNIVIAQHSTRIL